MWFSFGPFRTHRQAPFGDFGQILRIDVSELLGHQPWHVTFFGGPAVARLGKYIQWIGLRENLQETIDFPIKYGAFL
jgi:hypothetical protein